MESRKYDLVLFGATGFTGKLVAAYLYRNAASENIKWAIAGRNSEKLVLLKRKLENESMGHPIDIIQADISNPESLRKMTLSTKSLMTTVGPFDLYGEPVVKACVDTSTHYLDITGEPLFIERIYKQYHKKAKESGVAIVHCCGFDSIPADLGTWLTVKKLPKNSPVRVQSFFQTNAQFSGGTWTTAVHAIHRGMPQRKVKKSNKKRSSTGLSRRIHYNIQTSRWAIPMPVVDHWVVRRTSRALPSYYGEQFQYAQYFSVSTLLKVIKLVFPIILLFPAVKIGPVRKMILQRLQPGEGPDPHTRKKSFFKITFFGESGDKKSTTVIKGGDPGYDETAKMFSEAAFALLEKNRNQTLGTGVLTPVQAFGEEIKERLIRAGIKISEQSLD
jgi:saccharopine dehydrogenase (NAD+, L-glutamate forming)